MRKYTKDFNREEFLHSEAAIINGLSNEPGELAEQNLQRLTINLLQPLRDLIGAPIAITSGYRSEEINKLVGGVPNSQHCLGEAADCYVVQGPEYLLSVLVKSGLAYDQAIVYKRKRFLHLSYRENCNRMMVLRK